MTSAESGIGVAGVNVSSGSGKGVVTSLLSRAALFGSSMITTGGEGSSCFNVPDRFNEISSSASGRGVSTSGAAPERGSTSETLRQPEGVMAGGRCELRMSSGSGSPASANMEGETGLVGRV